jgi:Domain of unknown function (DUF397)
MPSYGTSEPESWRRSSFCAAGECVEVTKRDGSVLFRDSKNPSAGTLSYTVDEFRAFVQGIRAGEFDDLCAL